MFPASSRNPDHEIDLNPVIVSADGYTVVDAHSSRMISCSELRSADGNADPSRECVRRYEINDRELIYYPEITWNEAWNGTRQIRYFELAGDLLKISSAPAVSTLGNAETIMTMAWNRVT
jgi:hypothetical protein